MPLKVVDANGAVQNLSTTVDGLGFLVGATAVTDPTNGQKAAVSTYHTTDGNAPPSTTFSLFGANVPLLVNLSGNLDRLHSAPGTTGVIASSSDGVKATYRYCTQAFSMVATPTDVVVIQGSSTKTVRIKRVMVCGQATAQGAMPVQLVRRSAADSGGSGALTAITATKHDINDGAATATVSTVGTGNYSSLGTSAGIVAVGRLGMSALATGTGGGNVTWDFCTRQDKAIILRGTSDFLCINFSGAAIPSGGVIDFEIEAEEDAS